MPRRWLSNCYALWTACLASALCRSSRSVTAFSKGAPSTLNGSLRARP